MDGCLLETNTNKHTRQGDEMLRHNINNIINSNTNNNTHTHHHLLLLLLVKMANSLSSKKWWRLRPPRSPPS